MLPMQPLKIEAALSNGLGGDTCTFTRNTLFDLGIKVTRNVAQYPLHHVIMQLQSLKLLDLTVYEEIHLQER